MSEIHNKFFAVRMKTRVTLGKPKQRKENDIK
jgi:hypothetical protein